MCTDMGAPPTRRGTYMCTDMRVHTHTRTEFSVVGNPAWYTGGKRGVGRQCLIAVEGGAVRSINFFPGVRTGVSSVENPLAQLPHGQRQNTHLPSLR